MYVTKMWRCSWNSDEPLMEQAQLASLVNTHITFMAGLEKVSLQQCVLFLFCFIFIL